ncbi:MATE family efflux transporter [Peloplasma aerotolerans]|uniref:Probable multidrug resistance protein NorM n=1 Tax=Peloplasma aerotolerans TaxID=3044389 RepID=A0AAW6U4C0_9MOLU|nr:MATE family efflux transporter [Mariniplasma sp. M4Ah]MDI6452737.1 MATE family efflux transporter [Mariniplasma sp. M4Ah]
MKHLVGDRAFYKTLISVAAPLVLQQLITTSVQLVDNVMVGRLGEQAIGSVAVVNQLYFIVILVTFGALGGAGIFTAQYYGSKDYDRLKETFRFKVIVGFLIATLSFILFTLFGRTFMSLFTDNPVTIQGGLNYLNIIKWSAFPWILSVAISNTFREIGITKPLLKISIFTILANTALNFILIFGLFGFPALGIIGAAIATLIARVLEFVLTLILLNTKGSIFNTKLLKMFVINKKLLSSIVIMAIPLTINELLWSSGQTAYLHAYSTRGDSALAAMNITGAISQLVFVMFGGIATAVAVMVGNTLGKNELEQAKDNAKKLIAFSVGVAIIAGMILFILSFFILGIYDVVDTTKQIAAFNIRVNALFIPFYSFNVALYFTLRAGGDTKSTMLIDSGYMWVVPVPIAMVLAYFTQLPVTLMFLIVQSMEIPKMLFGLSRYQKGYWIKNLAIGSYDEIA